MDQKLQLLKGVPLFARLDRRGLEEVGRLAEEIDVGPGRALMREGESGHEFYIIVEGAVRIERQGREINELGPGEFFGEIALIDGGPRTADAITATATRLLVVSHREFRALLDDFPDLRAAIFDSLAQRVRQLEPHAPH